MKITLTLIEMFALMLSMSACLRFSNRTTYDPVNPEFYRFQCLEAMENCKGALVEIKTKFEGQIPEEQSRPVAEINALLKQIEVAYDTFKPAGWFSFYDHSLPILDMFRPKTLKVVVLPTGGPYAKAFPNGEILVSRGLIDGEMDFSAKNKTQLIGLLAHEFFHIIHGHVCFQFASMKDYQNFRREQRIADLSSITEILPITYRKYVQSSRDLNEAELSYMIMEHLADLSTVMLLLSMKLAPDEYIDLLERLWRYEKQSGGKIETSVGNNQRRIQCLKTMLQIPSSEFPPCFAVVDLESAFWGGWQNDSSIVFAYFEKYWWCCLSTMGKPPSRENFIVYEDGVCVPRRLLRNIGDLKVQSGKIIRPVGQTSGLVFPDRIWAFPLFPFIKNPHERDFLSNGLFDR